ncbi:putative Dihydroxyacetone kinase [Glarea lozoyensis 74030]|uniref:Putative Dihydroxyacetone kinase n=1 Tax=Glarea lozoyensis (strain ATCC 74030 / MF5533) TaxID=1104152 RepID=H0EL75_GLAL7|nr:putative Dihydroxyacetone kinase [Glarea lozoyensis 74030]
MKQVLAAIASVPSEKGTILLITNYTGDKLHFGLAAERALAAGFAKKVVVLPATDDVSIGRSRCEKVGRRGLAGNVINPERGFVRFSDNDDTVLLINNYGGLSNLELGALTQETLSQLVDPTNLEATVRLACERAIKSEPDLTKWDMVMGDGDCGEAVKGVCEGMSPII